MTYQPVIMPEVDRELGQLYTLLFDGMAGVPWPDTRPAFEVEARRRMAVRKHMIAVGRTVKTAADLIAVLKADGTLDEDGLPYVSW